MSKLRTILAVAFLAAMAAAVTNAADITGQWSAVIDTMMGQVKWSYTLKLDGSTLTGTATDNNGAEVKLEEGKVDGDTISFVENREIEGLGPTKFTYTGKIVSADEMHLHRTVGEVAEEDLVAKRAK